jgi:hypothetical protein
MAATRSIRSSGRTGPRICHDVFVAPAELLSARSGFGLRRQVDQDLSEGELMMIEMCAEVRRCSNHDPRSSRTTESHGHSNEEHS